MLLGGLIVAVLMLFLWCLALRIKNAGLVDLGWSLALITLAAVYTIGSSGLLWRRAVIGLMVFLWAGRLAAYLFIRLRSETAEDSRYRKMRADLGARADGFFLIFFMFQALVVTMVSYPFLAVSGNSSPSVTWNEWAAILLWVPAFIGECISDAQLRAFKMDPRNRGRVCDRGLWNYSRHPNYFFECLLWVSYALFASSAPYGAWAWLSPALMIFFILKLSGVPPSEEQSLRSRGEAYRQYQKTTSMIIPWFKKSAP